MAKAWVTLGCSQGICSKPNEASRLMWGFQMLRKVRITWDGLQGIWDNPSKASSCCEITIAICFAQHLNPTDSQLCLNSADPT